jgi:hypothetical protein
MHSWCLAEPQQALHVLEPTVAAAMKPVMVELQAAFTLSPK